MPLRTNYHTPRSLFGLVDHVTRTSFIATVTMRSVLLLNVLAIASAASMARDFANKRADGKKGGGLRQLKPGDGFEPKGAKPKKSESERAKKHERAKKERGKRAKEEFDLHEEVEEIKEETMQVESVTETGWLPTPSPTTLPPGTPAPTPVPTPLPTLDPLEEATLAPSVDVLETIEPSEDVLADGGRASSGPPCPTSYDPAFTNYVAGDEVEMDGSVFVCLVAPYEKYCNIAQKDEENWSEEVMTLWGEAWEYVGPCEMAKAELVEESEGVVIAPPLPEAPVTTDAPVQTTKATVTTTTATDFPTTAVYPTPSPTLDTLEELPPICPLPYNPTKTTYAAGDIAEVHEHIFRCREGGKVIDATGLSAKYELYCSVPSWDEALLEDNPLAEEMWNDSWVYVEPCQLRTMEEVLEEEALGA